MSVSQPLHGKTVVVTRPLAQSARLAKLIAAQGGSPVVFPLLDIGPAENSAPLRTAVDQLDRYTIAVFVSPNAVDFSIPPILSRRAWPAHLQAAAIGQSSVSQLSRYGIAHAIAPRVRFDSEALLELPELQAERIAGKRIVVFRGNGGRAYLGDVLRERGAEVDHVTCYHRSAPNDCGQLLPLWQTGQLDALTISSSEGLRNLVALLNDQDHGRAYLASTPVFVPHQRIAEVAAEFGLQRLVLTGPADAGIIAGLCAFDWQR